jgi:hypothetical protein
MAWHHWKFWGCTICLWFGHRNLKIFICFYFFFVLSVLALLAAEALCQFLNFWLEALYLIKSSFCVEGGLILGADLQALLELTSLALMFLLYFLNDLVFLLTLLFYRYVRILKFLQHLKRLWKFLGHTFSFLVKLWLLLFKRLDASFHFLILFLEFHFLFGFVG